MQDASPTLEARELGPDPGVLQVRFTQGCSAVGLRSSDRCAWMGGPVALCAITGHQSKRGHPVQRRVQRAPLGPDLMA